MRVEYVDSRGALWRRRLKHVGTVLPLIVAPLSVLIARWSVRGVSSGFFLVATVFFVIGYAIAAHSFAKTFDWRLGATSTRAFAGDVGGTQVVVFVAKDGPYQGVVVSAVVPDASQIAQWGL